MPYSSGWYAPGANIHRSPLGGDYRLVTFILRDERGFRGTGVHFNAMNRAMNHYSLPGHGADCGGYSGCSGSGCLGRQDVPEKERQTETGSCETT